MITRSYQPKVHLCGRGVDIGTQDFAGIVERVKAERPDYIIVLLT